MKEAVRQYYGEELKNTGDLKTPACCAPESVPLHIRRVLPLIADEVSERFYGCESPIPLCLRGVRVLDLGCGAGRDVFVLSKLVGESGFVHGIDMTEQQVEVAGKYVDHQMKRFRYKKPNVKFILDDIENTGKHFKDGSIDLVISNCVVNLLAEKELVLRDIYRILKYGGEFYFSDIYTDRRLPDDVRRDPVLYSECLGGALYHKDFERMARMAGFREPRTMSVRPVDVADRRLKKLVGNTTFYSVTYRLWKLSGMDDACEDYGHVAVYKGGVRESPYSFELDRSHFFERNRPERVCGNTALMLSETRFRDYFDVIGSFREHFGEFEACGTTVSAPEGHEEEGGSEGCGCR